jgi:transcriptional regulator with XRE-family HTH domain
MTRGFKPIHPESQEAIGMRLQALRKVLGKSQQDMGEIIGSGRTNSQWSAFENGERRISTNKALALTRHPELIGLTLEWIYKGVPMFTELGERVREAERAILAAMRQPDEAPRRRRRRVPN